MNVICEVLTSKITWSQSLLVTDKSNLKARPFASETSKVNMFSSSTFQVLCTTSPTGNRMNSLPIDLYVPLFKI